MVALASVFSWRRVGVALLAAALLVAGVAAVRTAADEIQTSRHQATRLARLANELRFEVQAGASDPIQIHFPGAGPYDQRLGYHPLPRFVERLTAQDYRVSAQARMSPQLVELSERGLFTPYREKTQAGLELFDCRGEPLFAARFPTRVYGRFEAIPPMVVDALLFMENRELLDAQRPRLNPAIDWSRLARAVVDQALRRVDQSHPTSGGSTLATQIEKYRHSPEGRTDSIREKLRQVASASLRAYLDGEETLPRRRQIVADYLDSAPLAARAGFGEVNGLGDGLWAWYGRDFGEVNQLLADNGDGAPQPVELLPRRALAFKQVLSLLIALRRPSFFLGGGENASKSLAGLTDSYLRVMAEAGVIPAALRDAALPLALQRPLQPTAPRSVAFSERKATTALRTRLSGLLEVPRAYDLDRLDLEATSSLDGEVQRAATTLLRSLGDRSGAKAAGLFGFRLLNEGDDPGPLVFSFTLFERGEHANRLRVQTDNLDQPFDINEGARLDLGSTAKLRTLLTYLELVGELHARWSGIEGAQLAALPVDERDALGLWARQYLSRAEDRGLPAMLAAAMERRYSASPAEAFFTGGGLHRFENFEPEDNARVLSVREALTRSVNLVFIRLMRDVVQHLMVGNPGSAATLRAAAGDPARQEMLARFADKEGREFLERFYRQYQGRSRDEAEALLLQGRHATPVRLASLFGELEPATGAEALAAFIKRHMPGAKLSQAAVQALHDRYGGGRLSLADRGYLAGRHPLELWLAGFLRRDPQAKLSEVFAASGEQRQAVYGWLFNTRHKSAQDVRIRSLLEIEAFADIQRRWRRLGYPFESLTPSYATSIGASGDRPAALAELMGIIVNRGLRLPVARIESLVFARGTPYETRLDYQPPGAERVLDVAVAEIVHGALIGVVTDGSARRLKGAFVRSDGTAVEVGGKTGTGDHRFDVHGRGGRLISSRVVNRSATFAFLIGDRYFGTVMAYVHEPDAAHYRFTSALSAQLLKSLAPALQPLLDAGACR
ncbi:transglycosylase domain-containing protein [Methylibium sp.]|uniref:transglycosylase domain-containing protein n=1 Tax=Methylibium sp. TaxID=2067992 RepID=UPI00286A4811|nr:transglycosylase domain-containing protein [Methylibium sp.]